MADLVPSKSPWYMNFPASANIEDRRDSIQKVIDSDYFEGLGDLLAAIDLLQTLESNAWTTTKEAIAAWEQRDPTGKTKPKAL
jgi:hypothetical protein